MDQAREEGRRRFDAALEALLQDLPTRSDEACLSAGQARQAIEALIRLASVRADASAAVYGHADLAEALGPTRIALLADLLDLPAAPPD